MDNIVMVLPAFLRMSPNPFLNDARVHELLAMTNICLRLRAQREFGDVDGSWFDVNKVRLGADTHVFLAEGDGATLELRAGAPEDFSPSQWSFALSP